MCEFFSFCSLKSKPLYFNAEQRKAILKDKGEIFKGLDYNPDSHTSIANYFGQKGVKEDKLNKYEYNPLLKTFEVDQINDKDDRKRMEKWVRTLDFKTIVPELIIKPILNPFSIEPPEDLTKAKKLLKTWTSVWDSIWVSVWDLVKTSVKDSVKDSVGDSIWDSVGNSVWDSVWISVKDSVRTSIRDSVGASVWDSIWAYISSFFDTWKDKNPYQSAIDLWEMGLFPAYDGKIWYLISKNGIEWKGKL